MKSHNTTGPDPLPRRMTEAEEFAERQMELYRTSAPHLPPRRNGCIPLPLAVRFERGHPIRELRAISLAVERAVESSRAVRELLPPGSHVRFTGERAATYLGDGSVLPIETPIDLELVLDVPESGCGVTEATFASLLRMIELICANSTDLASVHCRKGRVEAPRPGPNIQGPGLSISLPTEIKGGPIPAAPQWIIDQERPFEYMRAEHARVERRNASER